MARSGTRGEHVDVLGSADEGYVPPGVAPYVARVLRSLGYRTTLHVVPFDSITPARAARFHLHTNGDWLADYPSPSSYLPPFFSCDGGQNHGFVCVSRHRDRGRGPRCERFVSARWFDLAHVQPGTPLARGLRCARRFGTRRCWES